jgi:hypothetical protein
MLKLKLPWSVKRGSIMPDATGTAMIAATTRKIAESVSDDALWKTSFLTGYILPQINRFRNTKIRISHDGHLYDLIVDENGNVQVEPASDND